MIKRKNRIDEFCKRRNNPVTIEAMPYRGSDLDKYFYDLEYTGITNTAEYMNVCDNPVGVVHTDPSAIAQQLLERYGIDPIVHVTCNNSNLSTIQRRLLGLDALDIKNLLIVTGDGPIGDYKNEYTPPYMNSVNIIKGIRYYLNQGKLIPDYSDRRYKNNKGIGTSEIDNPTEFTVGGVFVPGRTDEINYTIEKINNGADFLQTQIVYDKHQISSFIEDLTDEVERCPPILLSVRPVSSFEEIRYIAENIPQVKVPNTILKGIKESKDLKKFSVEMIQEIITFVEDRIEENSLDVHLGIHIIPGYDYEITKEIIKGIEG